jgi:hypothetical protein
MPLPLLPPALARRADLRPPVIRRDAAGVRTVYKAVEPEQITRAPSGDGAFRFVITTETRDLMGDVVVQAGREDVSERIPAQVDHSGEMRDLIGYWTNIQTRGLRTFADLVLHAPGLSQAADMVRALLDAGVRMAASIGFTSIKREWIREPDTDEGRITGIRFLRWKLIEASIVVVPANPEALSTAKSLLPAAARAGFDEFVRTHARRSPSPSRAAAAAGAHPESRIMTIAERIAEARRQLAEQRNALTAARERLAENEDDDELVADAERLAGDVTRTERTLRALGDQEATLAANATPAGAVRSSGARSVVRIGSTAADDGDVIDVESRPARGAPAIVRRRTRDEVNPADLIVRSALLALESHITRQPVESLLVQRYADHAETRAVAMMVTRAAQPPAMATVPGWAQELVRESFGAFMDLLMTANPVVPRLPLMRFQFDQYGKITLPSRKRVTNPNLAAAFRAEGAPIRVGALVLQSQSLTPKSMAVIGTYTNELFQRSTPNIETVIREGMIQDTNEVLDGIFTSALAPVAGLQPPGLQYGVVPPNTAPSGGVTPDKVKSDLEARVTQMLNSRYGRRAVWIMHETRWLHVKNLQNAVGLPAFPETANGLLMGYPVYTSLDVPSDVVIFVDTSVLAFAGGAPMFAGTDVATLHEEDTTPLPITSIAAGSPPPAPTVAAPVRSLFQTNAAALRSIWEIDWSLIPGPTSGAVQTITGVAW